MNIHDYNWSQLIKIDYNWLQMITIDYNWLQLFTINLKKKTINKSIKLFICKVRRYESAWGSGVYSVRPPHPSLVLQDPPLHARLGGPIRGELYYKVKYTIHNGTLTSVVRLRLNSILILFHLGILQKM